MHGVLCHAHRIDASQDRTDCNSKVVCFVGVQEGMGTDLEMVDGVVAASDMHY